MIDFDAIYYEKEVPNYEMGKKILDKYSFLPSVPIENHNRIEMFSKSDNKDFKALKRHLILGIRKTHKYRENFKVSDYLVPFTSSGCRAMCLYCYLVCNYNKCSYLRIFVNKEEMENRLISFSLKNPGKVFEIGSNSDLILENQVSESLPQTIENFARNGKGMITFPTKFSMVDDLLNVDHRGKTIFRMSLNPDSIIKKYEIGTSSLEKRIDALNKIKDAGYPVGILFAPIILCENWKKEYAEMFDYINKNLDSSIKKHALAEVIFMTYSFVQNAINKEAFPKNNIFNKEIMRPRGRGKYCYKDIARNEAECFIRQQIEEKLGMKILYIV